MPPTQCCGAAYALVAWRSRGHIWAVKGTRTALQPAPFRRYGPQGENHWIGRPREADLRTKTMNSSQYKNIQDPIARAEALRAEAIANPIFDRAVALRTLAQAAASTVSGYCDSRRTHNVLRRRPDPNPADIGIHTGHI